VKAYELMLILDPGLDDEGRQGVVDKIQGIVTADGGVVESVDQWGKRRLAFEIGGHTDGDYSVSSFRAAPAAVAELDRVLRITDPVIRFMVVRRDDLK